MIEIVTADITKLEVDAIVNAANETLRGGGGVDGAIHAAAGPGLLQELMNHPGCPTGEAVLSKGYRLPAHFVIHTVGPIWSGGGHGEAGLLARAYESSFRIARDTGQIRSIAFPAISTGIYGFPKREGAEIALTAMRREEPNFDRIVACLFDDISAAIYRDTLARLETGSRR